jgi:hypothetical protein
VAPHTTKIHTPITLGIRRRTKSPVFKPRRRRPFGFDSHRPLHSQATPGHVGLQDWRQHIDRMGKSWEIDAAERRSHGLTVSLHCPGDHTYSHTQQFTRINCVIPTLSSDRERPRVAGLDPLLTPTTGSFRALGIQYNRRAIWLQRSCANATTSQWLGAPSTPSPSPNGVLPVCVPAWIQRKI